MEFGVKNKSMKKSFSPANKAAVAIAAIKGELTGSEISSQFAVHPTQIGHWKNQALKKLPEIFSDKRRKENFDDQRTIDDLYKALGQKNMELEWLKKKIGGLGPS